MVSSTFTRTTRSNSCQVCGDTSGDCRQLPGDTILLHFCMKTEGEVSGFRLHRKTKDGLWNIYTEASEAISGSDWEERRQQWAALALKRKQEERERHANSMPAEQRDRYNRQLISQLPINNIDRDDLLRRGLTDEQIKAGGFRSVEQWQELDFPLPDTLPGVQIGGRSLNTQAGYLCPFFDVDGRIVAFQVRKRSVEKGNKYSWLSSRTKNRPNGPQAHLPNGENPLTVARPVGAVERNAIGMAEGSLKPFIAAQKLGQVVVGAAGRQFAQSEQTLKYSLERLSEELGTKKIHFYPDGGAVLDRVTIGFYRATWKLLKEWGYSIQVGWWGQVDKGQPDIDELENLEEIEFISPEQFLELAIERGYRIPQQQRKPKLQLGEPDPKSYAVYINRESERFAAEKAEAEERLQQQRQQRSNRFRNETDRIQAELNGLRIKPTIAAQGRYIPSGMLSLPVGKPGILLADGSMGIGKTSTSLKEIVEQHRALYPSALRMLAVPRNLLGFQSGNKLGLPHHTTHKGFGVPTEVTLCLESLWKLQIHQLPEGPPLILFDEISQTLKQILYGDTCGTSHALILNRLRQILRYVREAGGWIVLSEDGITNKELDFIQEASGLDVVQHLHFERIVEVPREYSIYNSPTLTWEEMQNRLQDGENLMLVSDSDKWLRETERMLIEFGILEAEIKIIDGRSSQETWAREATEKPDKFITANKPRILGISPSAMSGVSFDDKGGHFSRVAFHLVHLEPREAKQLCDRLRPDVPRFGYVKERAAYDDDLFSGCRPDLILRDLYRNVEGISKLTEFAKYVAEKQPKDSQKNSLDLMTVMENLKKEKGDPDSTYGFFLRHWARYKASETFNKLELRNNLIRIWEDQGHNVTIIGSEAIQAHRIARKRHREELDKEEAKAFSDTATDHLSRSEAQEVLQKLGSTVEERRAAHKRLLQDKLPSCNLNELEFVLKAIVKDDGVFLRTTELLWMARNPEAAKFLDRWNWLSSFSRAAKRDEIVWLPRLTFRSGQAKLLHQCPLQPFIDGVVEQWDNNSPEAIAVHEWALLHARQLRRYLRLTVLEDHPPVRTVNKLLRKLGFEVQEKGWKGSRENRLRQYAIANLHDVDRDAILKALNERFLEQCSERKETPPEPVIATRIDISPLTSCDHEPCPDWPDLPPECCSDLHEMWLAATDDHMRRVVLGIAEALRRSAA